VPSSSRSSVCQPRRRAWKQTFSSSPSGRSSIMPPVSKVERQAALTFHSKRTPAPPVASGLGTPELLSETSIDTEGQVSFTSALAERFLTEPAPRNRQVHTKVAGCSARSWGRIGKSMTGASTQLLQEEPSDADRRPGQLSLGTCCAPSERTPFPASRLNSKATVVETLVIVSYGKGDTISRCTTKLSVQTRSG
jgi:hypothetical protein